jgi:hypothetical protein
MRVELGTSQLHRELPGDLDFFPLRCATRERISRFSCSSVGMRRYKHKRVSAENSISIILSQLADLGVKKNSKRSAKAWDASVGRFSWKALASWVLRLSCTNRILSSLWELSRPRLANKVYSFLVRRKWTYASRFPVRGSMAASKAHEPFYS